MFPQGPGGVTSTAPDPSVTAGAYAPPPERLPMTSDQRKRQWPRLTRRQTLTAAASATLGAAALTVPGLSAAQNAPGAAGRADEPIVVHLRDAASGTMDVFVGESRIEVRDRGLADRLRRAARR